MIWVLISLQGIEIAKERMRIIKLYEELKKEGIPHYFSYLRTSKINTYLERF
ncbi:MAG: hypothetical protein ACUVUG_04735 [Candidatus Aminicenantia bacterium]